MATISGGKTGDGGDNQHVLTWCSQKYRWKSPKNAICSIPSHPQGLCFLSSSVKSSLGRSEPAYQVFN